MSRFLKRFISIILGVFMLSSCFSCTKNKESHKNQKGDTYYNYIEVYDDKGRVCRIGDPYILKYNGVYYLYTSCTGHMLKIGIPCWTSTNLVDWTFSSWIWGDGNTDYGVEGLSYNAYAPEIVFYKGWFYLCEAPNGNGHYIFKSKTPNGKFELCSDNLGLGIDGHFYIDDNGELYLIYADSGIKYHKLKIEDGRVYKEEFAKSVTGPYLSSWIEGPEVFDRAGYTYLLYTGNHVNSASYRMAYGYLNSGSVFNDLQAPENRILLLNTGDDTPYNKKGYNSNDDYLNVSTYRGLGHGCAVYGPNLDSIYLGYHSQGRLDHTGANASSFDRRFNLTQMYTNQKYLTTNGICITDTPKPTMADYTASKLVSVGDKNLTANKTNAVYTAEINFKLQNDFANIIVGYQDESNYTEIVINGVNLQVNRYIYGVKSVLGEFNNLLLCENQSDNYHAIKVVNGYNASSIYYDNRLIGNINSSLSKEGKIGVVSCTINGVVSFTNDAYGTSDFESAKNLTSTFPAFSYLKGENRGYSIQDATVKPNGIRQGEKESTISLDNATAIKLNQGDWVKYNINAEKIGEYAFNVEVSSNSKNCVFEVVVDDTDVYKMEVKNANYQKEPFVLINAGNFNIKSKGIHSLKVRVVSGSLEMRNISTQKNAEKVAIQESLNSSFNNGKQIFGSVTFDNGLITDKSQSHTVYYVGNKGVANFNFSMDISLIDGSAGMLIRAKNFSYSGNLATIQDALQGYLLEITNGTISLYKFNSVDSRDLKDIYVTSLSETNNFKVMARQNILRIYLNDTEIFRVVDTCGFIDGYCGIYSENSSAKYTNLVYQPL